MNADFGGYATKAGLKCSDGRTILPNAFESDDGAKVPLVWQHGHSEPSNVLGHAVLENRSDGVYAHGFFNETPTAANAKTLVKHGDIVALSIYANSLVEKSKNVMHGKIREVSLVLSGANPGALIDTVNIRHSDGEYEELEDAAVIYTGETISHSEESEESVKTENETKKPPLKDDEKTVKDGEKTVKDIFDSMTEEQKNVVYYMIGAAASPEGEGSKEDDADEEKSAEHKNNDDHIEHQEGADMTRNVFESNDNGGNGVTLTHSQVSSIMHDAEKIGSLRDAVMLHAQNYGIENIDLLFPDAKAVRNEPDLVKRRTEWVNTVLSGTHKSPFSRIKSLSADLTHDDARAKGYIKGNMKKDEFFGLAKRETGPKTIYKKQKLDRDDIIDITDLDVVAWLKAEMRIMLDEEIARAILVGDGREVDDPDKIDETKIRPIAKDDEFYTHRVELPTTAHGSGLVEHVLRSRRYYKGSGNPTFFTTEDVLTDLLLVKDKIGRRLYETEESLKAALRVSKIEVVDVMEDLPGLLGVMVNLSDYTNGSDRGGEVSMFDDFDIDFNQYKYLLEARLSGALTKPKTALAFWRNDGTEVIPTQPSFNSSTNVLTIPTVTGVDYVIEGTYTGDPSTGSVTITGDVIVEAIAEEGYYLKANIIKDWAYTYNAEA